MLWCAVVLLLSPIPGGWLLDHCPVRYRFPEASWLQDQWRQVDPRNEVLLLGSSRTGTFVQNGDLVRTTRQLTGDTSLQVFNATVPAGEPNALKFIATKLLETGKPAPRLAIVEINPDLVSRNNTYFWFVIGRQLVTADLPHSIRDIVTANRGRYIMKLVSSRLTPFYRHRTIMLDWALELLGVPEETTAPSAQPAAKGYSVISVFDDSLFNATFGKLDAKENPSPEIRAAHQVRDAAVRARDLRNYKLDSYTSASLEQAVAMLQEKGTTVILVRTPFASPLRADLNANINDQFAAFVQHLQSSYGCGFVDLSARIPDTGFTDLHHATMPGRVEYTDILAREVVAPAWSKLKSSRAGDH